MCTICAYALIFVQVCDELYVNCSAGAINCAILIYSYSYSIIRINMNICICYYEYYIEYNYNLLHNYILYIGIPQAQHISVYKYMNISHIIIIFAVTIVNDNAVNLYGNMFMLTKQLC